VGVGAELSIGWRATLRGAVSAAAQGAWHAGLALAVPRACLVCGAAMPVRPSRLVCGACVTRVPMLPKPWCARCGHPLKPRAADGALPDCPLCPLLDARCTRARSVCWVPHVHSTPLLAALKYQGWWGMADTMADLMARTGRDVLAGLRGPVLVPVPLAPSRLRERGYNQCVHLARALGQRVGVAVRDDLLARARATVSQTQLTPAERRANVHHAFVVPAQRSAAVLRRSVVLVDDVLTTGATLNACAEALLEQGASDIRYWTFGRARSDADRP
jgi:ComF family protein